MRSSDSDRAKNPRPSQVRSAFATLRLCVEIDAGKTQRRKDAKSQGIKRTRARRRTVILGQSRRAMTKSKNKAPAHEFIVAFFGCKSISNRDIYTIRQR